METEQVEINEQSRKLTVTRN